MMIISTNEFFCEKYSGLALDFYQKFMNFRCVTKVVMLHLQQSHEIHCNLWVNQSWKTKGRICSFQK